METIAIPSSPCPNCGHQSKLDIIECTTLAYPQNQANYIPALSEETKIRDSIEIGKETLSSLKREIERLGNVIKQLEARYDETSAYVFEQQAVISPIRHLPEEVLSEIFKFYLGNQPIILALLNPNPWRLGQICHHWRNIILSMPTLWSNFILSYLTRPFPTVVLQRSDVRLESCLQRSGNSPLTFTIHYPNFLKDSAYWSKLVSECHRWRHLTIYDSMHLPPPTFKGRIPILSSLRLYLTFGMNREDVLYDFEDAPNLSTVELARVPDPASRLRLPWKQINRLVTTAYSTPELVTLFGLLPNIVVLHLGISLNQTVADFPPIIFARLEELELQGKIRPQYMAVLQGITAPRLTHMKVEVTLAGDSHTTSGVTSSLIGLLRRSSCSLTRLFTINLTTENICEITEFTPALKTLGFAYMRDLLRFLLETGEARRPIPPNVQEMRIEKFTFYDYQTPTLVKLLNHLENSKLELLRSLQKIHIDDVDSPGVLVDAKKAIRQIKLFNTRSRVKIVLHFTF